MTTALAPLTEAEVLDVANRMCDVFGRNDTEAYFAHFDEAATFIFYYEPSRLNSREEYRQVWDEWMSSGVRVTSCRSLNQKVQIAGTCALFLHDVESTFEQDGEVDLRFERETIVYERFPDGSIRSVHEHLSKVSEPN